MSTKDRTRRKAALSLPPKPPGTKEDLRELLHLLYGVPPRKLADPLFPSIRRIAIHVLARERACRAGGGAAPGLAALDNAIDAVRRLEHAANAIPAPLDSIVAHRLRMAGFQPDALARLSTVFEETGAWARERITGEPEGKIPMGPGDIHTRLDGDGPDRLIEEAAALFGTVRGDAAVNADPMGNFTAFAETFWRMATGEESIPNLPRRISRMKVKATAAAVSPA